MTSSVRPASPTRLPSLTFSSPIRPVDRSVHLAIAQVDLGVVDGGLGLGDLGLGAVDVDLVVGLGLIEAGPVGLDLGRALQLLGLGLVVVFLRSRLARQQDALAALFDFVQPQLGLVELRGWPSRPRRPWKTGLSRAMPLAAASCALAWSRATWNGFSSITSKSWSFLTFVPSSKCRSVRKPFTRARMVTSSRARVVPIGLTMIGTVILFDSTTVTDGGGGTRSGVAVAVQPARPSKAATRRARAGQDAAGACVPNLCVESDVGVMEPLRDEVLDHQSRRPL